MTKTVIFAFFFTFLMSQMLYKYMPITTTCLLTYVPYFVVIAISNGASRQIIYQILKATVLTLWIGVIKIAIFSFVILLGWRLLWIQKLNHSSIYRVFFFIGTKVFLNITYLPLKEIINLYLNFFIGSGSFV